MFEGRIPWDLTTEIRTAIECVEEELRGVVKSLERVSQLTTAALRKEYEER